MNIEMDTIIQHRHVHGGGRFDYRPSSGLNTHLRYATLQNALSISHMESHHPSAQRPGSKMVNSVARLAHEQDKRLVQAGAPAATAQGFYLKMGMRPATAYKRLLDNRFGAGPLDVGSLQGRADFADRFRAVRRAPVWEGATQTVRRQSARSAGY